MSYTLWIENYSNKADNAGFFFETVEDAVKSAHIEICRHGIKNLHSIKSLRYKFSIEDENGNKILNKTQIKNYYQ